MISFRDVTVTYPTGTVGLDSVTLDIEPGEFVVVVGLSGAGKSTLVRSINGLVPVTSGELLVDDVHVDGAKPAQLRRLRSRIGMIFQSFNLVGRSAERLGGSPARHAPLALALRVLPARRQGEGLRSA